MKKTLATGLSGVALSLGSLALGAVDAQAAIFSFDLVGTFGSGGTVLGSFEYNDVTNAYTNWTFTSNPTALDSTSPAFANPYVYTTGNSSTSGNTNTSATFTSPIVSGTEGRELSLDFAAGLNTLDVIGESTTLLITPNPANGSNEFYFNTGNSQAQLLGLSGGTITRTTAVPEPLTMLGAATAVAFGASFKRRALKNAKKG